MKHAMLQNELKISAKLGSTKTDRLSEWYLRKESNEIHEVNFDNIGPDGTVEKQLVGIN